MRTEQLAKVLVPTLVGAGAGASLLAEPEEAEAAPLTGEARQIYRQLLKKPGGLKPLYRFEETPKHATKLVKEGMRPPTEPSTWESYKPPGLYFSPKVEHALKLKPFPWHDRPREYFQSGQEQPWEVVRGIIEPNKVLEIGDAQLEKAYASFMNKETKKLKPQGGVLSRKELDLLADKWKEKFKGFDAVVLKDVDGRSGHVEVVATNPKTVKLFYRDLKWPIIGGLTTAGGLLAAKPSEATGAPPLAEDFERHLQAKPTKPLVEDFSQHVAAKQAEQAIPPLAGDFEKHLQTRPSPGASIPEHVRRHFEETTGQTAPTHYPKDERELSWWADMALAAGAYGATALALSLTTGGIGIVGTSATAAPIYMGAKYLLTGKKPTPGEAAIEMAWWVGTPVAGKAIGKRAPGVLKGIERISKTAVPQPVQKAAGKVAETVWENITVQPESVVAKAPLVGPKLVKGTEWVRETFQPAVERLEKGMPKVARTFRKTAVWREFSTEAGTQLRRDLEKVSPSIRYWVGKGLEPGTKLADIADPTARAIVGKYRKLLREAKPEHYYRLAFEDQLAKGMMKTFRAGEDALGPGNAQQILQKIESGLKTGKAGEWQDAFRKIINDPTAQPELKQFLKDIWSLPASTPKAVADATRTAHLSFLEWKLQRYPGLVATTKKPGYVQSQTGDLKGLWVPKDVELEMKALREVPQWAHKWYNKWFLSPWKTSKVILRPATHMRNLISNAILNDWGGLPVYRVDVYARALKEMRKDSTAWKEFRRLTGVGGTFAHSDVYNLEAGLRYGANMLDRMYNLYDKMAHPARSLYSAEESMFKFAKYLHNLEQGISKTEAATDALKWTFNYGEITPGVAAIRSTAAPFATWYFKAIPLAAETAVKHPVRFWKWPATLMAMQAKAMEEVGLSEDEWKAVESKLPEYIQKGMYLMMPWRDQEGRLNLLNLTYIMPGLGDVNELYQRMYTLDPRGVAGGLAQNPLLTLPAALISNKKFSGAPIYYDWEEPATKWMKSTAFVWESISPAPVPGGTDWNALWRAVTEVPGAPSPEEAVASFFGFKLTPIDPREAVLRHEAVRKITEAEMTMQMNRELRRARNAREVEAILERYRRLREKALE